MPRSYPRQTVCALAVLMVAAIAGAASPASAVELRTDMQKGFCELSDEVVTPHIVWAKPYIDGPTRALVIAPRWTQRETLELAQRMSLEYVTIFTPGSQEFGVDPDKARWFSLIKGQTIEEKTAETREKLAEDVDVIIIGYQVWAKIPSDVKFMILKKVAAGTGLVLCYVRLPWIKETDATLDKVLRKAPEDDGAFITQGVPFAAVPQLAEYASSHGADSKLMKLAQLKKGRVVYLKYRLRHGSQNIFITPSVGLNRDATWLGYEYSMSLSIRAILWAAKKTPDILIQEIGIDPQGPAPSGEVAQRKVKLALLSERKDTATLTMDVTVRTPEDEIESERQESVTVAPGQSAVTASLVALPAGKHFVDVWLREDGKVINWASTAFEVTSPVRIAGVSTDKERYDRTETAAVTVSIDGAPSGDASLVVELWDNFGRKLAAHTTDLAPGKETVTASFTLADCVCNVHQVKARLVMDGQVVDQGQAVFGVTQPIPDFTVVLWSLNSFGRVKRLVHQRIYELGLDGILCNASWQGGVSQVADACFHDNIRPLSTVTMLREEWRSKNPGKSRDELVRDPCLTNPTYREGLAAQINRALDRTALFGALGYSMGDEIFFSYPGVDLCFSPTCIASFREYVRKMYGSLDAVNKEWGTEYRTWEEVVPIPLQEAKETGRLAQWCDHRNHMDSVWADTFAYGREICNARDPQARVGADTFGGVDTWSAGDWVKLADACDMNFNYTRSLEESACWKGVLALQRSLFKKGSMVGYCYGGYMEQPSAQQRRPEIQRYYPWKILFEGGNAITWYAAYGYANVSAGDRALAPDLVPYPIFMDGVCEMREIKHGVGKLLGNAKRLSDVAIYYSRASSHAAEFDSALSSVLSRSCYTERYLKLLDDLGLTYEFVSYRDVKQGELTKRGYKVLVMPYTQALSDEEIARVKDFVNQGGMAIADFRPGVMDAHCKMRKSAPLDEVFGVKRSGMAREYEQASVALDGADPLVVTASTRMETNVSPTTATPLAHAGKIPAAMVNDFGKGKTCYLNLSVDQYASSFTDEDKGLGMRTLWEKLITMSDLARPVTLESDAPANLRALDRVVFVEGDAEYLGLLRYPAYQDGPVDPKSKDGRDTDMTPRKVSFTFPRKGHLYDVRKKKYLGVTDGAQVDVVPGDAHLFARLPYRVEAITLEDLRPAYAPGERLDFRIQLDTGGGTPATHVARVELAGPDGVTKRYYCQNLFVRDGAAAGTVRFALNDKEGVWTLRATDVTSGASDEKKITLKKSENQK